MSYYQHHIFVCTNQKKPGKTCCANTGGEPFYDYLKHQLKKSNLHEAGKIRVSKSGCLGRCKLGPCLVIYPEGTWYHYESYEDIDAIIQSHFIDNTPVTRLLLPEIEKL